MERLDEEFIERSGTCVEHGKGIQNRNERFESFYSDALLVIDHVDKDINKQWLGLHVLDLYVLFVET